MNDILPFKDGKGAFEYIENYFSTPPKIGLNKSFFGLVKNIHGKNKPIIIAILASKGLIFTKKYREEVLSTETEELMGKIKVGDLVLWRSLEKQNGIYTGIIYEKLPLNLNLKTDEFENSTQPISSQSQSTIGWEEKSSEGQQMARSPLGKKLVDQIYQNQMQFLMQGI